MNDKAETGFPLFLIHQIKTLQYTVATGSVLNIWLQLLV